MLAILLCVPLLPAAAAPGEDRETGEVRRFQHAGYIYRLAFSPDGKMLLTDDQLWETATGKKLRTLPLPPLERRHYNSNFWLTFSPDGRHIAIHRYTDMVLLEAATGKEVWRVEHPLKNMSYRSDVPRVAFTPDGKHLVSARNDGIVRVWDAANGKELRHFSFETHVGGLTGATVHGFGVSADGKRLVVHGSRGGHFGGPVLLELATGKELHRRRVSFEEEWVHESAPSPDCRYAVYPKKAGLILLDLETGKEIRRFEFEGKYAFSVAYSPDGKYVAAGVIPSAGKKSWIQCWEVATGKSLRVIKDHPGHFRELIFSPDGKYLLTGGEDKIARLWRVRK
jgi:WD40 repeat protein